MKERERSYIGGIKKNLRNTIVLLEIIRQYIVSGNTGLALDSSGPVNALFFIAASQKKWI